MRKSILLFVFLSILGLAVVFSTALAAPQKFDYSPKPDGFGFHNYGGGFPEGDLTIEDVRAIFGDQVCTSIKDDICTPTPEALLWIDSMNGYMLDGHCVGFTVASYRLFQRQYLLSTFDPDKASTFTLGQTDAIMHTIARNYVYQIFEEVYKATVDGSPKAVLEKLIKLNAPADVGIFSKKNAGHSVYAYAVEDRGNNIYWIKVYDSNAPGKDVHIEVDTKANTWKYYPPDFAPSSNPNDWQGDKDSNSLIFTPLSAYDLPPICPFCKSKENSSLPIKNKLASLSAAVDSNTMNYVTLTGGDANLELTNSLGEKLGRFDGEIINDIDGAYFIRLLGGLSSSGVLLSLPSNEDYSLQVNGGSGSSGGNVDVRSMGNGYYFSIDGLNINPLQPGTISISNLEHTISYSSVDSQNPILKLAFSMGGVDYMVVVANAGLTEGSSLSLGIDPQTGDLSLSLTGSQTNSFDLAFARIEGNDVQIFASNSVQLGTGGEGYIHISGWDGQQLLALVVGASSNNQAIQIKTLSDQTLGALILNGQTADQIISEFGQFSSFMNETENREFVNHLVDVGLNGRDLGKIFYEFDQFEMNLQELVDFILQHFTNLGDIAGFLYELHLSPDFLDQVLELLPVDWRVVLNTLVVRYGFRESALYEAEFLNISGPDLMDYFQSVLPTAPMPTPTIFSTQGL